MFKFVWLPALVLALSAGLIVDTHADTLQLGRYFTDDMVLQRDRPNLIRGMARPGQTLTVTFADQTLQTAADDQGRWTVTLEAVPANRQGQTLSAQAGDETVSIRNILVGDVFLFACQTSLDPALNEPPAQAAPATLRRIVINTIPVAEPLDDLAAEATTGWADLSPGSAAAMSKAAYQFAQDLAKAMPDTPIGVIDLNMGSAFPIGWLSRQSIADTKRLTGDRGPQGMAERMEKLAALEREGKPFPDKEPVGSDALNFPLYPAAGYNAVLHPLAGIALKGIVLQLGNNYAYGSYIKLQKQGDHLNHAKLNRAYVETYDLRKNGMRMDPPTAPRVPGELRRVLNQPELPIAWVLVPGSGLNPLADRNIEFRELQRQTAHREAHTDLIVPNMQTIPFSAQPRDAKTLGSRAAMWAASIANPQAPESPATPGTGPIFDRIEPNLNQATVFFKPGTAKGLRSLTPGPITGFEVAGVIGEYVPAEAAIDGEVIRLESDQVNRIHRVRYNWQRMPALTLVNAANLPAAPFAVDDKPYLWFHVNHEENLPMAYATPANQWTGGDVTLINGQTKTYGYDNFAGWLGPVGVRVGPFGPNMAVRDVLIGSPAQDKLKVGDVIYSVNGQMLGDRAEHVMADAITQSEKKKNKGELKLGLRRGNQNMEVTVELPVMGSYSPTAPFDCPKSEKIVANLERWVAQRGGVGDNNFLSTDTLFLLSADNPDYQGLVRRYVYNKLMKFEGGTVNWYLGYNALLLSEYYLATGDRHVLPALKRYVDNLIANQIEPDDAGPLPGRIGGWYGKNKAYRTYPTMPSAGLVCAMALSLAKESGIEVDPDAYDKAIQHFVGKGAPVGKVIYGDAWRDEPQFFDPQLMEEGKLSSDNGKISIAAVLFDIHGDVRTAHMCSLISTYAFSNTYDGHGGNFWNNFWTPLGSYVHGQPAYEHFMQGHRWYREMNRLHDGSMITDGLERVGAGHGIALTIPKNRLRITGAPKSPFAADAPAMLRPAINAYQQRHYAQAEQLVDELIKTGTVPKADLPTVEKLGHEARQIQRSMDADFKRVEQMIKQGRFHEAKLDLPQLQGVAPADDPRFAAIEQAIAQGQARPNDETLYQQQLASLQPATSLKVTPPASEQWVWTPVVTEAAQADDQKKLKIPGMVLEGEASVWHMRVVENLDQAPRDWMQPGFDDANWDQTTLPISWALNHTVLLRTTFTLDDPDSVEGLRFRAWLFRQQDMAIYLNGQLIGRVNNLEKKTSNIDGTFKPWAVSQLKAGENTLAVTTRQNWRWGMLFMRVYNNGFGFILDVGRSRQPEKAQQANAK